MPCTHAWVNYKMQGPGSYFPYFFMFYSGSDDMDSVQAQKNWKKSIMLVWRAAANHK